MDVKDYEVAQYLVAMADNKGGEKKPLMLIPSPGMKPSKKYFRKPWD